MTNAKPLITVDARGCLFSVVGNQESMPATFLASIRKAKAMELLLIGGGVKGFKPEHSAQMKPWILEGLKGFVGVAFSGGTAYYDKETGQLKSDIVTSIPAYLAAENLTDAEYQEVLGYPALGRSLRVGLRFRSAR